MKLKYSGRLGGPFGWGVFGQAMTRALAKHFTLTTGEADVSLMPLADHGLRPATDFRAPINIGVSFFESALEDAAMVNAQRYDTVFVGSSWCLDRLGERGIPNGQVLVQGVDHDIFKPMPRKPDGQFRIFSGGKFEWRKGQDLVIAAFREFSRMHPDTHLVCAWHNPWPSLISHAVKMANLTRPTETTYPSQEAFFHSLLCHNAIPQGRFTVLPQLSQPDLASAMCGTDVGLFPNRCEGGTNLVLMEYAACGGKVIANVKTGHRDVAPAIDFAIECDEDDNQWASQRVERIVDAMEFSYLHRESPRVQYEKQWTWEAAARTVADEVGRIAATNTC